MAEPPGSRSRIQRRRAVVYIGSKFIALGYLRNLYRNESVIQVLLVFHSAIPCWHPRCLFLALIADIHKQYFYYLR